MTYNGESLTADAIIMEVFKGYMRTKNGISHWEMRKFPRGIQF